MIVLKIIAFMVTVIIISHMLVACWEGAVLKIGKPGSGIYARYEIYPLKRFFNKK